MDTTALSTEPTIQRLYGPRLSGAWRLTGVILWAILWLVCLATMLFSAYRWYQWDSLPVAQWNQMNHYTPETPDEQASKIDFQNQTMQLGFSLPAYGTLFLVLRLVAGVPFFIISVLIMRRRSDRLMAVIFAGLLAVLGAVGRFQAANWSILDGTPDNLLPMVMGLNLLLDLSAILLFIFPDGRFVPGWSRWSVILAVSDSLLRDILYNTLLYPAAFYNWLGQYNFPLPTQVIFLIGVAALVYRYARQADTVQKQQIKWLVVGLALLVPFYVTHYLFYNSTILEPVWAAWTHREWLILELALEPGWYVAQGLFAVCIAIALLRYRLWEVDLIINRLAVYGLLTVLILGAYLGAVWGLGSLLGSLAQPAVFFLAAGLIALLLEPLRRLLQRMVNRLMFGERDNPYSVLTRLASTLERSASPAEMLPAMAATIVQAMKVPYAAILANENGSDQPLAVAGKPGQAIQSFPLMVQSEIIGALQVSPRGRGEEFSAADHRLIENIARQTGAAVQAVRLNSELARSRTAIVSAREEERRRLRRDLHDGLGPLLASQTLKMAAVRQLVRQNPERAETLVDDVIHQNENTVTEVRRLVYGLRPPSLDELGLAEAVCEVVRRSGEGGLSASGLEIRVSTPEGGLPPLPAAVEVNAYRIALEGMTNAARHAHASHCTIRFFCEIIPVSTKSLNGLCVQIEDDGTGMPKQYRAGVGLRSMRERAEELGGHLVIEEAQPHGARVTAWLPLVEEG
ncbi:MAG TPA: sensor histidine kinase [Anaerolineaceae bacterium]|nr:sensor histidine kinase [Anaerolineaceae bacterium]